MKLYKPQFVALVILAFFASGYLANVPQELVIGAGVKNEISQVTMSEKFNASPEIKAKYQIDGTALKMVAKDNPKDMIRVEIGDAPVAGKLGAIADFTPKIKISRWDEVSLTLTPKLETVATKDKNVVFEAGKIKYKTPKEELDFYDLANSTSTPEGGYEVEWILNEKPLTNKVEFQLDTQGLDFFYQPELTAEEIEQGASRPDNVVGSYAVYASEQKTNWTGGKEYKTGKVGQFYAPEIIDAVGNKVKGNLHIENGILSVTIPQDFLDKAVYPVRHAAGLTFGYTTNGSASASIAGRNDMFETWTETRPGDIYAGASGTLDKISGVFNSTAARDIKVFLNTKDSGGSGNHGQVVAIAVINTTFAKAAFTDFTAGGESISAVDYILSAEANASEIADGESITFNYDTVTTRPSYSEAYNNPSFKYASPESPWLVASANRNAKYSIYATYTASGGAAAPAQDVIFFD